MTVALITGAGSGIGRELARCLVREGSAIAAIDCNEDSLKTLEAEVKGQGGTLAYEVTDVTDGPLLLEKVAALQQRLGPIDMLIACAGVGRETSAYSLQVEDLRAVIGVNLLGVVNSVAAVLPGMLERKQGKIVGISSMASFRGVPRMLAYCASKAGLNAFMDGLRLEVRSQGIQVTTVCPGWIRTPMTANIRAHMPGLMNVDQAAREILRAVRRRKTFYAFPPALVWRLRVIGWLPRRLSDWLIERAMVKMKRS